MREKALFGVFQQVAVHFADLHDTPGRMKAKGTLQYVMLLLQNTCYLLFAVGLISMLISSLYCHLLSQVSSASRSSGLLVGPSFSGVSRGVSLSSKLAML